MPEFAPTRDQQAAIEQRGSSILVSAGAGSGKTRVLTERLMQRLQDAESPVDLDRFLVITYTRPAAGELRSRITQRLGEALARDPGNKRLRRQSALVPRTQIGTIHSFCAAFLREFSHMAGIGPDFTVLDEQRAAAMKANALERVLEQHYEHAEKYPGFLQLADTVGAGRDDRRLGELVLDLHGKMQSHARPKAWAEQQRQALWEEPEDISLTPWGRELMKETAEAVSYWIEEMEDLLTQLRAEPAFAAAWLEGYAQSTDELRELRRCLDLSWERSRACFPISFPTKRLNKSPDKERSDALKARRDACKRAMEKIERLFALSQEEMLADRKRTAPAMEALLELVNAFDDAFVSAKHRANLLDFSDLEHLCAKILLEEDGSPSALALQVRERWEEILVDEFQDVNRVQDELFRAISRDGKNLFMVGDVKQSIYRFRLADPGIFLEKYRDSVPWDRAEAGEARRILLRENFRSRREVLDGANAVFSRCMSRALGEVEYNDEAALRYGARDYRGSVPKPELLLLRLEQSGGDEEAPDKQAHEAAMVGEKILELMGQGVTVQGREGPRPLEFGDIAILLRSANTVGPIYRRVLTGQGIPVGFGQGDGFFQAEEISAVISLLAVLDNPHQDIPLIAVLRFPALGFDADELSAIRAAAPDADFFTALRAWSTEHEKGQRFLALLERLRRAAPDLRAADLIEEILEELDMLAVCSAMRDGEQRRARLMELSELSERFEKTGYRGLHRFVLWLRRMAEKGQEPALGEENLSAVHMLSIHKSKGLEFPVVFLSDLAHQFNRSDLNAGVLVHPELGLGPKIVDLDRRMEYDGLTRMALRSRLEREAKSEELRVLYVGMTRAKERLFMTAGSKDPECMLEKIAAAGPCVTHPYRLGRAMSPLDWLLAAVQADGQAHLTARICEGQAARQVEKPRLEALADPHAGEELERRLAFTYSHREAETLPSKLTATELKDRAEPDPEAAAMTPREPRPFRLPEFAGSERPLTGAEKGTVTHLVLQHMDLRAGDDRETVSREVRRLTEEGFLSQREAAAVDKTALVRLLRSPLGRRMRAARELRREFRFSLLCDASEFYDVGPGEEILLQGVVDCYWEDEDGITVVDYKTDWVADREAAEKRAERYGPQLRAYGKALERICGKPVKECLLYFLGIGETVSVERGS